MKFYATVICRRVIELDTEAYEQALIEAGQQVEALLPDKDAWHPQIKVSAVRGTGDDRYYVFHQTANNYQVRERQIEGQSGPDDPLIRPFGADRDSAHYYARSMNEQQRQLDQRYGRWTKHAATPEVTQG